MPTARWLCFVVPLSIALALGAGGCRAPEATPAPPQSGAAAPDASDYDQLRSQMVEFQLRSRGIKDRRVLEVIGLVPREEFVPEEQRPHAYEDRPLPIGEGQTISQPYIVALMTELLDVERGDTVLEIGTGSGYQAAVLAELTPDVCTIEIVPALAERAAKTLARLGYDSVEVKAGDGYLGWPEHAPFDGIIVTCAPEDVPQPLQDQLAEGGRMVIPVGSQATYQRLYVLTKEGGKLKQREVIPVSFVPMVH